MKRYLLDTQILIWWLQDRRLVREQARREIADRRNTVFISSVVPWEISIKASLNPPKLRFEPELPAFMQRNGFTELPITIRHAMAVYNLPTPTIHKDPFDRLLIAQALVDQLTIITRDEMISQYPVPVLAG
jgi:PIN domain nuclease of toxin-antitoxin system